MNNTPQTDAAVEDTILHDRNHPRIDWVPASFGRELERERDEAKETNLRQTERIRYLEGATNHACGTPLSVALRERDKAMEALMKIEDLFIDGTDIYADRESMGLIAREALGETK